MKIKTYYLCLLGYGCNCGKYDQMLPKIRDLTDDGTAASWMNGRYMLLFTGYLVNILKRNNEFTIYCKVNALKSRDGNLRIDYNKH